MSNKSPWQLLIEKRTKNIGFMTRSGAFSESTPSEKTAALYLEINHWQATKGKVPWKVSQEYTTPVGFGINLKRTRDLEDRPDGDRYRQAILAYVNTPMDIHGILKSQGIDTTPYERKPSLFERLKEWWKSLKDPEYEEKTTWLRPEFIAEWEKNLKEKR